MLAIVFMLATRDKIIQGAVTLFVKHGVAQTTTREIASQSQVAEGSIYRYFPSKEELAWQVFRDYHHHLAATLHANAENRHTIEEKITILVDSFLRMADEDWLMFRFYLTGQQKYMYKIDANTLTPYQVILEIVERGIKEGVIARQDPHLLSAMAMGIVHQVAINKQFNRIEGALSEHIEVVANAVCRIVLPRDKG